MLLAAGESDVGGTILGFVLWALIIVAYWVPTIVAFARGVPAKAQVLIVNLFLGWTFIGWVVALVMSFRQVPRASEARSPSAAR
jgi:Superinfection immunity protein